MKENRFGQSGGKKKIKIQDRNTTRNPSQDILKIKRKKASGYTSPELRGDLDRVGDIILEIFSNEITFRVKRNKKAHERASKEREGG